MSVSEILEIPQITEAQSNKATAFNEAMSMMERAVADVYHLPTSTVVGVTSSVLTLDYDDTDDLSNRDALRFIFLNILAGASANFIVILPDNKHLFYCKNGTPYDAVLRTQTGTSATVRANSSQIIYCDGEDTFALLAGAGEVTVPQDFNVNYFGRPEAGEVVANFFTGRPMRFPANFAGSVGRVGSSPSASYQLTVFQNDSVAGTVTVSAFGQLSFSTNSGNAINIPAGRRITVQCQNVADADIRDIQFSLLGTVEIPQP